MSSYFDHNGHNTLMPLYVGETRRTTSYFFCYDSLKSASSTAICGGSVIWTSSVVYPLPRWRGVIFLCIQMTGSYFSELRWDDNCCNSLHEYKDYPKTHPLQYAQMINFILITKGSPNGMVTACRTACTWLKKMAQRCSVNRQHHVFFYMRSLKI